MKGYLYTITNKITGKQYVGKTYHLKHRWEEHLSDLRNNKHHSTKLQRSYNKHGENNFKFEYQIVEIHSPEELSLLEIKTIEEKDTYYNGYNETLGGDGNKTKFSYEMSVLLYNILKQYNGVDRAIARKMECDASCLKSIRDNGVLYEGADFNTEDFNNLKNFLNLDDANLIENYVPHNLKKLTEEQCFDILTIIKFQKGYDKILCEIYSIDSKLIYRLRNDLIYKDVCFKYNSLPEEDKEELFLKNKKRFNLDDIASQRQRKGVKNSLTQEQVNYILDNKDIKKRVEIAKELNISADRVGNVILGKSYKDLVNNYYKTHSLK